MKLHRSGTRPDWARRPRKRWNEWQKLAAFSDGILTLGNAFTLIGFVAVVAGLYLTLKHSYVLGLVLMVFGRLCDVLDGWLADITATKSPLGAQFDAGIDKLETALTIVVLVVAQVMPLWAAVVIALPQAGIGILAYRAIQKGKAFSPSAAGKMSMVLVWLALTVYLLSRAIYGIHSGAHFIDVAAALITMSSAYLGVMALRGYRKSRTS